MPLEKQFNVDDALNKAMSAFWAHGYEATSVQDLLDRMGINRGSLYATFGDKRSLFLRALRHYDAVHREAWTEALARSETPKGAILAAFDGVIAATLDAGSRDGCLLVNTALELSPHDEEVSGIVRHALTGMEVFFRDMIVLGQRRGEIRPGLDPDQTARSLLGLLVGLRVLSRSRPEEPLLRSIATQAAAILESESAEPNRPAPPPGRPTIVS